MTAQRNSGDCNMTVENRTDPPVKNSVFVNTLIAILSGVLGILLLISGYVWSQTAEENKKQTGKIEKHTEELTELKTALPFIVKSLEEIKAAQIATNAKVDEMGRKIDRVRK